MKVLLLLLLLMVSTNFVSAKSINSAKYIKYINEKGQDPKDYIFSLFKKYDYIILAERTHPELTQWDFIYELIEDKRFQNSIGNIFTEYGASNLQVKLDEFMKAKKFNKESLLNILRNFGIYTTGWNNNNIYNFLVKLYKLNKTAQNNKKINLYFSDIYWKWEGMTKAEYDLYMSTEIGDRDKVMAKNIFSRIKKHKIKKGLIVMNTRHAYLKGKNTGYYLKEYLKDNVASVMFNYVARNYNNKKVESLIQNGDWDAAFRQNGNKPVGIDFSDSPFGNNQFDYHLPRYEKYKYKDIFHGMIFYTPLENFICEENIKGFYSPEFLKIALDRTKKILGMKQYKRFKKLIPNIVKYSEKVICSDISLDSK